MTECRDNDSVYMRRALQLARLGESYVSPNPMVGAVIVCDGKIIGEGYHRKFGGAHAEVNAVNSVANKDLLSQSTIYVTLEPCSHYGKTPPCAKLLVDCGIKRVVVGCVDPNPKVACGGVAMLRSAGIEVTVGVLEQECRSLNEKFITAHTLNRPYVMLKWAQTADSAIAYTDVSGTLHPIQISTPFTRMLMHHCRAQFDAILVGANTYATDRPKLTVRHWFARRNPLPVVLDPNASLTDMMLAMSEHNDLLWAVYEDFVPDSPLPVKILALHRGKSVLEQVLEALKDMGAISLMVEGGLHTLQSFIDAGLFDEIRVEQSLVQTVPAGAIPVIAPDFKAILKSEKRTINSIISVYKR